VCFFAAGFTVLVSSAAALAQGQVAVSGVVEDDTGGVLPAATVTLVDKGGGRSREADTDAAGRFAFADVPPGSYSLEATTGDLDSARLDVDVGVEPLTVRLRVRFTTEEEVTVTASAGGRTEPDRNLDAVTLGQELLQGVPIDGGDVFSLVRSFVAPGAGGGEGLSIVVDGVEADHGDDLPSGAIRRVVVDRNPYGAEFRRPGRARIEVTTRRGSRTRFHGTTGVRGQGSPLDARNAFSARRPDGHRWQLEQSLSGPLGFRESSFFVAYQRLHDGDQAVVNARTASGPVILDVRTPSVGSDAKARVDLRLGSAHTLTASYGFDRKRSSNVGVGGFNLPERGITAQRAAHDAQLAWQAILASSALNTLRLIARRRTLAEGARTGDPAITVAGAFAAGPSPTSLDRRETLLELEDAAAYTRRNHAFHLGFGLRMRSFDVADATNFGGIFEFSGLDQFQRGEPYVFRIRHGRPDASFRIFEAGAFLEDKVRIGRRLTVAGGLRYDWQSTLGDGKAFAPRLSLAHAARDNKTVLRAGGGVFFERLPEAATERALLRDGVRIREAVITNPSFPTPPAGAGRDVAPSVVRVAADIRTPCAVQFSLGVERELHHGQNLTIEYQGLRGRRLLRSRDINAPRRRAAGRPDARFLSVHQVESTAAMRGDALTVTFRGRDVRFFTATAQYTLSRTMNDSSGPFFLPADSSDLGREWGRADDDRRHRLSVAAVVRAPAGFRMGTVLTAASGIPFDLHTGSDDNGDSIANDRPPGVSRNTGKGPGLLQWNLRLTKAFRAPRPANRDQASRNLELSADVFNVLNHVNYTNFVGIVGSPYFGRANAARAARKVQLSLRYRF
jgi:hypothetical protein